MFQRGRKRHQITQNHQVNEPPRRCAAPLHRGELGTVLYFFICVLLMCRSGTAYPRICSNCAAACFHILFIPSAYACGYPRICSNCAAACFHILFIPSAYACGYPRICSNCAAACFHILGFIARERSDRGDPVIIKSRIRACINYWIASFHSQ